eukprot:CAMPEP_0174720168 /NCGR_PEP_ID=MMETSP1094-20130205/32934_1 /TAXON_ID=156173 /ORGANISM="Chrysochromulina brevifilum, Strain UTEX LB 985" /LENGTH=124 /DNA_ID=CAMNT_0015920617 /DNA_START=379 /DNA_END=753 /DNA_ORIENTATION=-
MRRRVCQDGRDQLGACGIRKGQQPTALMQPPQRCLRLGRKGEEAPLERANVTEQLAGSRRGKGRLADQLGVEYLVDGGADLRPDSTEARLWQGAAHAVELGLQCGNCLAKRGRQVGIPGGAMYG